MRQSMIGHVMGAQRTTGDLLRTQIVVRGLLLT